MGEDAKLAVQVGSVGILVIGASVRALSAATVIAASGGAIAVGLAGLGIYMLCNSGSDNKKEK